MSGCPKWAGICRLFRWGLVQIQNASGSAWWTKCIFHCISRLFYTSPFKVGFYDGILRISWYRILYQATDPSTGQNFIFFILYSVFSRWICPLSGDMHALGEHWASTSCCCITVWRTCSSMLWDVLAPELFHNNIVYKSYYYVLSKYNNNYYCNWASWADHQSVQLKIYYPIPHKNDRPSTTRWQLRAKAYNNNQFTVGEIDSSHIGLTGSA